MKLAIVESPAKAKTISKFLNSEWKVLASVGHVRELVTPSKLPKSLKKSAYSKFGVDIDDNFKPYYVISPGKQKIVRELKDALKNADELYLATDEDREGEAIAWHLTEVLKPKVEVKRMVFHEITKSAIDNAIKNYRDIDLKMVDSQETRRILDRLFGFEISPVLWQKIRPKLSAGRVQSVALKIIVKKEIERMKFVSTNYSSLTANFSTDQISNIQTIDKITEIDNLLKAELKEINTQKIASGKDFDNKGNLKNNSLVLDNKMANNLIDKLKTDNFIIGNIDKKPYSRKSPAPFITSTLQQEAFRKLNWTSKQTMRVAQILYESGLITYMRTDSYNLSNQAIKASRNFIKSEYGNDFLPNAPKQYTKKSKNAQEAHEAIRPAGNNFVLPEDIPFSDTEKKLYNLIFKRTIASQMTDVKGITISTNILGKNTKTKFSASGTNITHRGFLNAYSDEATSNTFAQQNSYISGNKVFLSQICTNKHQTKAPARYTQGSLIAKLESLGVGRPSTYATIISVLFDRNYIENKGSAIVPTWLGFGVYRLLQNYFADLIEYDFTAKMENNLDEIATGKVNSKKWLHYFYFGEDKIPGLNRMVNENKDKIDFQAANTIPIDNDFSVKIGKVNSYIIFNNPLTDTEKTASIPFETTPEELAHMNINELKSATNSKVLGIDTKNNLEIVLKYGRFGPYITNGTKNISVKNNPKIDFEEALKLLNTPVAEPEVICLDTTTNKQIVKKIGPFGPYITDGIVNVPIKKIDNLTKEIAMDLIAKKHAAPKRKTKGRWQKK